MKYKYFSVCLLCFVLNGCATSQRANTLACDIPPESRVAAFAGSKNIPGMAVSIGVRGELAWSHAYGYADLATSSKVVADTTMFRIGSTSKALTAFALARLAQEKRIDLDGPLIDVLPTLPMSYREATTRQLAGHLGGVRHYDDIAELGSNVEYPTTTSALEIFIDDPLVAPPGTEYSYSTYGYTLIAAAIEAVTGEDYLSHMYSEVFEPLKMLHTSTDRQEIQVPERSEFYYMGDDGQLVIGSPINSSYKWAGGGFLATAVDLVRFGMSHFDEAVLT